MTAVYVYTIRHNILLLKPEYLQIPKSAPVNQRKILTLEDIKRLFDDRIESFWYIHYVHFLLITGLRPGQAAGIRTDEDIQNDTLTIIRSINNIGKITDGKNTNALRSQYLPEIAQKIIADQRQLLKQNSIISPWLFPNPQGDISSPHYIYKTWVQFRDKNQITPCSLYELRHTMVSITKNGVPTHLLKMVLGHTEAMDTYGVYGHEFAGDLQNVANSTQNIFEQILKQK